LSGKPYARSAAEPNNRRRARAALITGQRAKAACRARIPRRALLAVDLQRQTHGALLAGDGSALTAAFAHPFAWAPA
jgi:hypothetical protein